MRNIISTMAVLVLVASSVSANPWYSHVPRQGTTVKATGTAISNVSASGSIRQKGTGHKEATSGAWDVSNAGATASFDKTVGRSTSRTRTLDGTTVLSGFRGDSSDQAQNSTHFHSYGTDSSTRDQQSNSSWYKGYNFFNSITATTDNSVTNYVSKGVNVITNANTQGGSFGSTLGYGSKVNAAYNGSAHSKGKFNIKARVPYSRR